MTVRVVGTPKQLTRVEDEATWSEEREELVVF